MKKKPKNPKCNNSMYISTKSPTVEIPAGIFRLAPVLWALILTGEDFLFSTLTHLIFIPEAHGFKSCCEGIWIFHLNLKDSAWTCFPSAQPGTRTPGAPSAALRSFWKFRNPAGSHQHPGPYLEPQVDVLAIQTHISCILATNPSILC